MSTDLERALALLHTRPEIAKDFLVMAGESSVPSDDRKDADAEVKRILRHELLGKEQEHFMVFAVDVLGKVIDYEILFKGFEGMVYTSPKLIYRWVLTREQVPHSFLVAHNHPNAGSRPSHPDIDMTDGLLKGSLLIGVELRDHFVIGSGGEVTSIRDTVNENMRTYGNVYGRTMGQATDDLVNRILGGMKPPTIR